MFQFVAFAALLSVASAGIIQTPALSVAPITKVAVAAPVAKAVVAEEYDPNPQYSYGYEVQDALTGDSKGQYETRQGDVVQGSYSVVDPDGTRRIVEYTADPVNGFNAVVNREPLAAPVAKVGAPLAYAAPAITKVAAPLAVAAPVARVSPYAQFGPVAKVAQPFGFIH